MLILKGVKVLCFNTLLQVLILKKLERTKIAPDERFSHVLISKNFGAEAAEYEQGVESGGCERCALASRRGCGAEFIRHSSTAVNRCQV